MSYSIGAPKKTLKLELTDTWISPELKKVVSLGSEIPEKYEVWHYQATKQYNPLSGEFTKLDLSGHGIKKLTRNHFNDSTKINSLSLDNNDLQRLDNIDSFSAVTKPMDGVERTRLVDLAQLYTLPVTNIHPQIVFEACLRFQRNDTFLYKKFDCYMLSASHNQLLRMSSVCRLVHLVRLDLSCNNILSIEGLKDLTHLKWLNLASNRIKTIEHLNTNTLLEHLDLSENSITHITNISMLSKLKELHLHKNHLAQLRHSELYLPAGLLTFTLDHNNLLDLNEVSHLAQLGSLVELSISGNPCVTFADSTPGFDYRPFLINWCMTLKVIDGCAVDDIESLKAEWLYSQGRGRQFCIGEQGALVAYLIETCPLNSHVLQSEQERKLRLILSKAHQHRQQLLQPTGRPKRGSHHTADELMTRSLDPALLDSCTMQVQDHIDVQACMQLAELSLTRSLHCTAPLRETCINGIGPPLPTATTLLPVLETLQSPCTPISTPAPTPTAAPTPDKLLTIRHRAQAKRDKKVDQEAEAAAVCIQRMWRGFHTRTLNKKVLSIYQRLQIVRTNQYIRKLSSEMEAMRTALDSEHKLQLLQMQAINALWRKVVTLQPAPASNITPSTPAVKELAHNYDRLNTQWQQLHDCMQEVLRCVSPGSGVGRGSGTSTETQTELTAVQTPGTDEPRFPFNARPSTLTLPGSQLSQYADCLVDGVIKTTVTVQHEGDT